MLINLNKTGTEADISGNNLIVPAFSNEVIDILLVDDSISDSLLTRLALDKTGLPYKLNSLYSAEKLIANLIEMKKLNNSNLPDILMLDLSIPGKNGFDILAELAYAPPAIRAIPVIIITNLPDFDYLSNYHGLGMVKYFKKPCDFSQLKQLLTAIMLAN